jgi:uncharacterized membrane protein YjjP (DUF1212 family)/uncharacterized membrane protein YjjB (DUF3815 family)
MRELRQRGELPSTKEGLAIELTLRVGDLLASAGAGAKDTVVTMRRICQSYGLSRAQLDVTSNVIMGSYYPGEGMGPITSLRTVSPMVPNLSKVYAVNDMVQKIVEGMGIGQAARRFDAIKNDRTPYPPWLAALATGGISLGVQLLYTISPVMLVLAFITGYAVNRFVHLLERTGLPIFFQQVFGGWLIVAFAAGVTWLNTQPKLDVFGYLSPTVIAVGCVFQLVAGAQFVAGIQDAIDSFFVTAAARVLQVVMLTAGLVIGLVSGLDMARRFGIDVYISSTAPVFGNVVAQLIGATVIAISWAASCFANRRTLFVTAFVTLIGWGVYLVVLNLGLGPVMANFAGPTVAAALVTIIVRRLWQIPAFGVIKAMGIPFVPGFTLYLGLLQLVGSTSAQASPSLGGATLGQAAAVALAIAAGASLGVFVARPANERLMSLPRLGREDVSLGKRVRRTAGSLRHLRRSGRREG